MVKIAEANTYVLLFTYDYTLPIEINYQLYLKTIYFAYESE